MRKETLEKFKNAAASLRLNVRTLRIDKYTIIISFLLCFAILFFTFSSLNKLSKLNYKSVKLMETKTREVHVRDTVSDCDTVFIIDGVRYSKIEE